jgi:hypothetical protein
MAERGVREDHSALKAAGKSFLPKGILNLNF